MNARLSEGGGARRTLCARSFPAILLGLTVCGLVLRVLCCLWGFPHVLSADEPTVVENAMDMLSRHSWIAHAYNRPDQFEIKCDAILFQLYSWLRYRMPAHTAFELHEIDFYVIARLFTASIGTLMIPLTALFTGKTLQSDRMREPFRVFAQLLAAGWVAFFPVFVQNSAFASPDIPLAFFSLLIAYLSLFYLESGGWKLFCGISILTGICISIKYPAAVLCPYIALIAIYRAVRTRDCKGLWKAACVSIALILITMFVLAPNLFIHLKRTILTIQREARPNHIGADGLGFAGNLRFYLQEGARSAGVLSMLFFIAGGVFLLIHRNVRHMGLAVSALYWVCLSVLPLHWERWGMPMYTGYIVIAAVGSAWLLSLLRECAGGRRFVSVLVCLCVTITSVNLSVSSLALVKWVLSPYVRIQATEYCEAQGISTENSIAEGFTILGVEEYTCFDRFVYEGETLRPVAEDADKRYFIHNAGAADLYYSQAERYPEECAFYDAVEASFPVIRVFEGNEYANRANELLNLAEKLRYLAAPEQASGGRIYIYDLTEE